MVIYLTDIELIPSAIEFKKDTISNDEILGLDFISSFRKDKGPYVVLDKKLLKHISQDEKIQSKKEKNLILKMNKRRCEKTGKILNIFQPNPMVSKNDDSDGHVIINYFLDNEIKKDEVKEKIEDAFWNAVDNKEDEEITKWYIWLRDKIINKVKAKAS